MHAFNLAKTPKTYFGSGALKSLRDIIPQNIKSLLFITGNSFTKTRHYQDILKLLEDDGILCVEARVAQEPSPMLVDEITRMAREHAVEMILAVGGGSVLDAGKAVSAMVRVDGSVLDYLEGVGTRLHSGVKIPLIAVPTTSGTGSEATKNAVLSEVGERGYKKSLRHDNFVPDYAIIDPVLTLSCPDNITAASGMDALNQLLESYLSVKANPFTDALALSGIQNVFESLDRLVQGEADNLFLREKMAYAAYLSGITLANAGLGIVHGFASSLGGLVGIPHGVICGKLNAWVMEYVIEEIIFNKELLKTYGDKLNRLFEMLDIKGRRLDEKADQWLEYLRRLEERLKLPQLGVYGLDYEIAKRAVSDTSSKESPVRPGNDRLLKILEGCI